MAWQPIETARNGPSDEWLMLTDSRECHFWEKRRGDHDLRVWRALRGDEPPGYDPGMIEPAYWMPRRNFMR